MKRHRTSSGQKEHIIEYNMGEKDGLRKTLKKVASRDPFSKNAYNLYRPEEKIQVKLTDPMVKQSKELYPTDKSNMWHCHNAMIPSIIPQKSSHQTEGHVKKKLQLLSNNDQDTFSNSTLGLKKAKGFILDDVFDNQKILDPNLINEKKTNKMSKTFSSSFGNKIRKEVGIVKEKSVTQIGYKSSTNFNKNNKDNDPIGIYKEDYDNRLNQFSTGSYWGEYRDKDERCLGRVLHTNNGSLGTQNKDQRHSVGSQKEVVPVRAVTGSQFSQKSNSGLTPPIFNLQKKTNSKQKIIEVQKHQLHQSHQSQKSFHLRAYSKPEGSLIKINEDSNQDCGLSFKPFHSDSNDEDIGQSKLLNHKLEFLSKKNLANYESENLKWLESYGKVKHEVEKISDYLKVKKNYGLNTEWQETVSMVRGQEILGGFNPKKDYKTNSIFQFKSYRYYMNVISNLLQYIKNYSKYHDSLITQKDGRNSQPNQSTMSSTGGCEGGGRGTAALNSGRMRFELNKTANYPTIEEATHKVSEDDDDNYGHIMTKTSKRNKGGETCQSFYTGGKGHKRSMTHDQELNNDNALNNDSTPEQIYNLLQLDLAKSKKEIDYQKEEISLQAGNQFDFEELEKNALETKQQFETKIEYLEGQLHHKKLFFTKVNFLMAENKSKIEYLENKVEIHAKSQAENLKKLDVYDELNTQINEKMSRMKEIGLMQLEDYNTVRENYLAKKKILDNFTKKFLSSFSFADKKKDITEHATNYKKVNGFGKQATSLISEITDIMTEGQCYYRLTCLNDIHGQGQKIENMADSFFKLYFIKAFEQEYDQKEQIKMSENYLIDKQILNLDDVEKLVNLKAYKPSFYLLVKKGADTVLNEGIDKQVNNDFSLHNVIEIIRGIFDSKFVEFSNDANMSHHTRFSEFCYVWLEKYTVDPVTKLVCEAGFDSHTAQQKKIKILLQLSSKYYLKIWECQVFKEFLEAKYSNDELYYYQLIRNYISRGRILDQPSGAFEFRMYIEFSKQENLINVFMPHCKENQKDFQLRKLHQYCFVKQNLFIIDIGLVLRVFLEQYRAQKQIKFAYIKQAYQNFNDIKEEEDQQKQVEPTENIGDTGSYIFNPIEKTLNKQITDLLDADASFEKKKTVVESTDKEHIDFEIFSIVLKEVYPDIMLTEQVTIYSDAYSFGNGKVTMDSFFIAAQDSGFFVRDMHMAPYSLVSYDMIQNNDIKPIYYDQELYDKIMVCLDSMSWLVDFFKEEIKNQGSEVLTNEYFSYLNMFRSSFKRKEYMLKGESIMCFYLRFREFMLKLVNRYIQQQSARYLFPREEIEIVWDDSKRFAGLQDTIQDILKRKILEKQQYQEAVYKIQKFLRNKIQKWYVMVRRLLKLMPSEQLELE